MSWKGWKSRRRSCLLGSEQERLDIEQEYLFAGQRAGEAGHQAGVADSTQEWMGIKKE